VGRRRRSFTAECKLEAVRLADESGKSPAEIARDLGIRPDILRRWRAQMGRAVRGPSASLDQRQAAGTRGGDSAPPA